MGENEEFYARIMINSVMEDGAVEVEVLGKDDLSDQVEILFKLNKGHEPRLLERALGALEYELRGARGSVHKHFAGTVVGP